MGSVISPSTRHSGRNGQNSDIDIKRGDTAGFRALEPNQRNRDGENEDAEKNRDSEQGLFRKTHKQPPENSDR
jgi:hypothetical protein